MFRIALVVNPLAGLGGPSGLKGSDATDTRQKAEVLGVSSRVPEKVHAVLTALYPLHKSIKFSLAGGSMGEDYFSAFPDFNHVVHFHPNSLTSAEDTQQAVADLAKTNPDLMLFAGGDGTARDVTSALSREQLCLGIPCGVKMHSGVFAITPAAVSSVVTSLIEHKLVAGRKAEVRDIDEASFAAGQVITRHYGELLVPDDQLLVQRVKCSGLPDDELALNEIAAFVSETYEDDTLYILGSGGSLRSIKLGLGIDEPTLLGVDVWLNGEVIAHDVNEPDLFELVSKSERCKLLLSVIGGQGIVLGRGNQQISPRVLQKIGLENIQFVATQERLLALEGQPLRIDSGDDALDRALAGFHKILCGYEDYVLYEIEYSG